MNVTNHPIDREEVMAFLDGELPAVRAAFVLTHLEECRECRMLADDLGEVSRQLAAWDVEPVPATLDRGVMSVAESPAPLHSVKPRVRWPSMASRLPRWASVSAGVAAAAIFFGVIATLPGSRRAPAFSAAEKLERAGSAPQAEGVRTATQVGDTLRQVRQIARTATLDLMIDDVDRARTRLDELVRARQGYVSDLKIEGDASSGRSLMTILHLPAGQLDAALAEFRALGRVLSESQVAEDVSEAHVDLTARLNNARTTEQRLNQIVRERTGSVADVLEAEKEIGRVRGEIERMDAQLRNLNTRIELAAVHLRMSEAPTSSLDLGASPASTRLKNALVEGGRRALETALEAALFVLRNGPALLLWLALLAWPARLLWRRFNSA